MLSATEVIRAFQNNSIDAACLTMDEVLLLEQGKLEPKVILVMDISNGGDVLLGKPYIKDIKQLKGKKVGVETSALGTFVLTRAMGSAKLSLNDIQIINITVDATESAFIQNKVDAVVTFEPIRSRLLNKGANILFDSTKMYGEILDVLIVRKEYNIKYEEKISTLISQWFKTLNYIETNKTKAIAYMSKRENISPKEYELALKGLYIPSYEENIKSIWGNSPTLIEPTNRIKKYMLKNNILKNDINVKKLFEIPIKENIIKR